MFFNSLRKWPDQRLNRTRTRHQTTTRRRSNSKLLVELLEDRTVPTGDLIDDSDGLLSIPSYTSLLELPSGGDFFLLGFEGVVFYDLNGDGLWNPDGPDNIANT